MAKHQGRGFATIEYPTGMNQNGDPSQAWIKLKPDGRVDVFSGTVDIGQGSKTVHTQIVADAIGVVAHEDYIKKNYDLLEKFALGLMEATAFIRKNPKESAEIATRFLDGLNVADATEGLKFIEWDPRVSVCTYEGLVLTGNDMIKSGSIKELGDSLEPGKAAVIVLVDEQTAQAAERALKGWDGEVVRHAFSAEESAVIQSAATEEPVAQ